MTGHSRPGLTRATSVGLIVASLWTAGLALRVRAHQQAIESQAGSEQLETLKAEGDLVFGSDCVACHGADGSASVGPALDGNGALTNKDHVVRRILEGVPEKGMPPFGPTLSDRQVAAAATFIRNSWENAFGLVLEADAKRLRAEVGQKKP